jgi:hypothetical protein
MQILITRERLAIVQNVTVDEVVQIIAKMPLHPDFWRACARDGRTLPFPPVPPAQPTIPGLDPLAREPVAARAAPLAREPVAAPAAAGSQHAGGGNPPAAEGSGESQTPRPPEASAPHTPNASGEHPEAPIGLPDLVRRICSRMQRVAVARRLGLTQSQIRHWISGRRGPSPKALNGLLVLASELQVLPDKDAVNRIVHAVHTRAHNLPKDWRSEK